jgi:hypothetical protein
MLSFKQLAFEDVGDAKGRHVWLASEDRFRDRTWRSFPAPLSSLVAFFLRFAPEGLS